MTALPYVTYGTQCPTCHSSINLKARAAAIQGEEPSLSTPAQTLSASWACSIIQWFVEDSMTPCPHGLQSEKHSIFINNDDDNNDDDDDNKNNNNDNNNDSNPQVSSPGTCTLWAKVVIPFQGTRHPE